MSEKLQKVLANMGLASRRKVEEWIRAERIHVNGKIAELGCRISTKDIVMVDGERVNRVAPSDAPRLIAYHKPVGEICTRSDPQGRPTVFSRLPALAAGRWVSIGRLDVNTSGLMLFTDNGELAHRLMHPSSGYAREYAVRVFGEVTSAILDRLVEGVKLDDGDARFEEVVDSGGKGLNHWYHVVVMQGRNRLVRRLWESQGLKVSRLMRVRFGPVVLESLAQGRYVEIDHRRFC
jgi:23S rRNA pseudouridine2605 synthase